MEGKVEKMRKKCLQSLKKAIIEQKKKKIYKNVGKKLKCRSQADGTAAPGNSSKL